MLTIAPGCELDVERGPDWLLVRVRKLDLVESEPLRWPSICGAYCSSTSPTDSCWNWTACGC